MTILFCLQNRNPFYAKLSMSRAANFEFLIPGHFGEANLPLIHGSAPCHNLDQLLLKQCDSVPQGASDLIQRLLSDPRSLYLAERRVASRSLISDDARGHAWTTMGAFGHGFLVSRLAVNSMNLLERIAPKVLVFDSAPHDFQSWVLGKTAEYLNLLVVLVKQSPLRWRFGYAVGIDTQTWVKSALEQARAPGSDEIEQIESLVRLNKDHYEAAEPSYMKRDVGQTLDLRKTPALNENALSWSSFVTQARLYREARKHQVSDRRYGCWRGARQKYASLREFHESVSFDQTQEREERQFAFFLHHQWERTSLPEGGPYAQQIQAIIWLRQWLPNHVVIVVKEHPVTLSRFTANSLRPLGFYSFVSSLPGVKIAHPSVDAFYLIDHCSMVGTLTGTVGFQALCRRRPVLAFGNANYLSHPAVFTPTYNVRSYEKIIREYSEDHPAFAFSSLCKYLGGFCDFTLGWRGLLDDPYSLMSEQWALAILVTNFAEYWRCEDFRKRIFQAASEASA